MEKAGKFKFGIWLWLFTIIVNSAISLALMANWVNKQLNLEDYWNSFTVYPWDRNPQHNVATYSRCGKAIIAIDGFLILIVFICIIAFVISKAGKHKAKYWAFYLVLGFLFFRFLAGAILLGNPTEEAFAFMDKESWKLWNDVPAFQQQFGNHVTNQYKSWYHAYFIQYNDQIAALITNGLQFIFGFFCVYFYGQLENQQYHKVEEKQGV